MKLCGVGTWKLFAEYLKALQFENHCSRYLLLAKSPLGVSYSFFGKVTTLGQGCVFSVTRKLFA
jgi:hypothetical protein